MKTSKIAVAAGAAFLFSPSASALMAGQPETARLVDENHESADDPATIVCKRQPPPAGSRIQGKKVCKTNAAWKAEREAVGVAARERQDRAAVAARGS